MFATLVIALPSEHEGGEVEATFGGQTMILDTASKSAFGFSWLAWYGLLQTECYMTRLKHHQVC